jgi:hypothetical protein
MNQERNTSILAGFAPLKLLFAPEFQPPPENSTVLGVFPGRSAPPEERG